MKMSEEMAVRLHRMMWSDMQKELGDTPDHSARNRYKEKWCKIHFPRESILFNCFLCDYCGHDCCNRGCNRCPIEWPDGICSSAFGQPPVKTDYRFAPISEILELADEKAEASSYYNFREDLLSKASGIPASSPIYDHVKAIQEKAIRESNLSKVYGDTKMELAKASGLKAADATTDHIKAIQEKAKEPTEPLKTVNVMLADKVNGYKDALSKESNLDRNRPVDDHIREIVKNSMEAGAAEERDRIQEKIYEVLLS